MKPGYVVAGMKATGLGAAHRRQSSLVFGKVKSGKVDLRDAYTSPWLGDAIGGSLMFSVSGEGRFIAGVVGRSNGREVNGIGLAIAAGQVTVKVGATPAAATPKVARGRQAGPSSCAPRRGVCGLTVAARPARRCAGPGPGLIADPSPAADQPPVMEVDQAVAAAAARRPAPVALAIAYNPLRLADIPAEADDPREGFRDVAPVGGLLVGVRVGTVEAFGADKVGAVQPIYQVGGGYIPGRRHGVASIRGGATVMARPG